MAALTTRSTAGTGITASQVTVANVPLTNTQLDTNFINLNNDIATRVYEGTTIEFNPTATGTSGANTIVVSSGTGIAVGQVVSGTGIATNASVITVVGTTITLSQNNTGTVSGTMLFKRFPNAVGAASSVPVAIMLQESHNIGLLGEGQGTEVITTISGTVSTNTITVGSATGLYIGQAVTGTGIGVDAVITSISTLTVTLSVVNSGAVSGNGSFTSFGVGIYGHGYTNAAARSGGVVGEGHVTATGDTGASIGVRGYANATHAGGLNIGLYGDAANGSSSYSLYLNNGGIYSVGAKTWTLGGNLTFSGAFSVTIPTLTLTNALAVLQGGTGSTTSGGARTNLGSTTLGDSLFTLTNVAAISFLQVNANNTVSTLDAASFRTAIGAGTSSATGTVTSVAAITLTTTGTDITSSVAAGTTTPVITLNVPTASATNRGLLSSTDWSTFNGKGSGTVTSVTATAPVASTGGTAPVISMAAATTSVSGYLTTTDWNTFNGKQAALGTGANLQVNSMGVGLAASGTAGDLKATGNITAYATSDKQFKENVRDIDNALDKVLSIGSKYFDWTDSYIEEQGGEDGYFITKSDFGVIAQDVQAVFPEAVRTRENGSLAVDYTKLGILSFAAIKELYKEVEILKSKLS